MSEECKYCKTSQTCLEMAEYGSIYCLVHREIPRVIEKTYEELQQENQELKEQLSNSHQIKNKQKEFIDWLENKMKETHYTIFEFQAYRLAFEKFKEIIGE